MIQDSSWGVGISIILSQATTALLRNDGGEAADAVGLTASQMLTCESTIAMSLPGLQLSTPVEIETATTIHELKEGSEWRFEVAFGSKIEVKVGQMLTIPGLEGHIP